MISGLTAQTFTGDEPFAIPAQPKPKTFEPSRPLSRLLRTMWRDAAPTLHLLHRSGFRLPY